MCMFRMINNICEYSKRTDPYEVSCSMLGEGRKILILSDRRGHLDELYKILSTGLEQLDIKCGMNQKIESSQKL